MRVLSLALLVAAAVVPAAAGVASIPEATIPSKSPVRRPRQIKREVSRIIGGVEAPSNEYKFITYLETSSVLFGGSICTGSLIASNVILTAAHCVFATDTIKYSAAQIQAGFTHDMPDPTLEFHGYNISKVIAHPGFTMEGLNDDIAVLILKTPVVNSMVTKVKVYTGDFYLDTPLGAAGFGMVDPLNSTVSPDVLMKVDLRVGSDEFCEKNNIGYNHKYLICTDGTAGKDTCYGDSGGPLITPVDNGSDGFALLGITSFGSDNEDNPDGICAMAGSSGFYTRAATYVNWIAQVANLNIKDFTITNTTAHADEGSHSNIDSESESGLSNVEEDEEVKSATNPTTSVTGGVKSNAESSSSGADRIKFMSVGATVLAVLGAAVSASLF
ncbi:trypsin-like cysteine/serine peptidase domain-containing protein [Kickxella alabastrina]|uniref:trypsin-like cysteine/serine peptidase domain-containing protein n=1 Tax=Kickxella alabastrina TaxID=61397 RepID=UPI00221FAECA|nr:trypsin-like cysteine/serine peptidase domain-containing protein [Kickxella alabastrina]KAI7829919.1 trypsin-like cysteine/serine peptidase domain-containing protein [Kickxella alabastrina]